MTIRAIVTAVALGISAPTTLLAQGIDQEAMLRTLVSHGIEMHVAEQESIAADEVVDDIEQELAAARDEMRKRVDERTAYGTDSDRDHERLVAIADQVTVMFAAEAKLAEAQAEAEAKQRTADDRTDVVDTFIAGIINEVSADANADFVAQQERLRAENDRANSNLAAAVELLQKVCNDGIVEADKVVCDHLEGLDVAAAFQHYNVIYP